MAATKAQATTELALPTYTGLAAPEVSANAIKRLSRSGDYLPRLQLSQGSSEVCKEGKIRPGVWFIVDNKESQEISDAIEVVVFGYRSKALDASAKPPVQSYDADSAAFLAIEDKSKIPNSNAMAGLEFLVWERSTLQFLTYFAYTKSAQFIVKQLIPDAGEAVQVGLGVDFIPKSGDRNSFHAPKLVKSASAFPEYPSQAQVDEELRKFRNPPKTNSEPATEAEVAKVAGRRR